MTRNDSNLTAPTARIVGAYVLNNAIPETELASLIGAVHRALQRLDQVEPAGPPAAAALTPARIRRSITPDVLISFEDGRGYRTLKRHLSARGMTMQDYRTKWGLPDDYPATAATYSARRSELAKTLGLGRRKATPKRSKPKR
jgi:predicted transcriptional regulator